MCGVVMLVIIVLIMAVFGIFMAVVLTMLI